MSDAPSRRRLGAAAAAAAAVATLVWCAPRTLELRADGGLPARLAFDGFHAAEGSFRWSRAEGTVRFPEPGPGLPVRVELELSGWRPPGSPDPRLSLRAGGGGFQGTVSRRFQTLSFEAETAGIWSSDLTLELNADTFTPGAHDPRVLGVRVVAARLIPLHGAAMRRPPLRPVVWSAAAVLLLDLLLAGLGVAEPRRGPLRWLLVLGLGAGLVAARTLVAPLLGVGVAALALLAGLAHLTPRAARRTAAAVGDVAGAVARGLRGIGRLPAAGLIVATALTLALVQWARPVVEVDLGSGRTGAAAVSFGPLDSADGHSYRQAERGARLELSDLGGGDVWQLTLETALEAGPRELSIVRAGESEVRALLSPAWTTLALQTPVPLRWSSGLRVEFPDAQPHLGLRVSRVSVDRGHSLPSPRLVALMAATALLLAAIPGTLGGGRAASLLVGLGAVAASAAGAGIEPLATAASAAARLNVALAALLLAGGAAAVHAFAARRGARLAATALVPPVLGFAAWLSALVFPLYRGGHFVFHSSIAEEIWGGRFLVYYLPYPGSMLSHQEHWGGLIFPHPCAFHVLVSPLAALGQPGFYTGVKVALALWLATLALCAALLARRSGGDRAAVLAGACVAVTPATFQIVGLGHLMTLLGCVTTALALTALTLRLRRLPERGSWWLVAALLAVALLSYFAAVPLLSVALGLTLIAAWRLRPPVARALLAAGLTGAAIAFALYYVNWAWPFLTETVPALLSRGGSANEGPALTRLLAQPAKLTYTFGIWLVPLAGLAGLVWRVKGDDRLVLWPWAALLPIFSVLDARFNFLLKHHYFTIVPVSVGLALVLERVEAKGRIGRVVAAALLLGFGALGARLAAATAFGWIP